MPATIEVFSSEIAPRSEGGEAVSIYGRCTDLERGKTYRVRLSIKGSHEGSRGDVNGTKAIWYLLYDEPMSFMSDRWNFEFVAGVADAGLQKTWPYLAETYELRVEVYQDYGAYGRKTPKSISVATKDHVVTSRAGNGSPIRPQEDNPATVRGRWRVKEKTVTGPDSDDDTTRDDLVIAIETREMYADEKWAEEGKKLQFVLEVEQRVATPKGVTSVWAHVGTYPLEATPEKAKGWSKPQLFYACFGNGYAPPAGGTPFFPNKQKQYTFRGTVLLVDDDQGVVARGQVDTFRVPPRRIIPGQNGGEPPGGLKPIE